MPKRLNKQLIPLCIFLLLSLALHTSTSRLFASPEGDDGAPMESESGHREQADGPIELPVGQQVYKIVLDGTEPAIYEITSGDLLNAGLPASTDPNQLQLMHYGEPVAYQLVNDNGDSTFDPNEKIRFYGFEFDESRAEKLYVNENIFWLIPGSEAANLQAADPIFSGSITDSVTQSLTFEVDDAFSSMRLQQNSWDTLGVEPDHFFWQELARPIKTDAVSRTVSIDLPHPTESQLVDATITAHMVVRNEQTNLYGRDIHGRAAMQHTNTATPVTQNFGVGTAFSMTQSVPNTLLIDGANDITFWNEIPDDYTESQRNSFRTNLYLNYIEVDYLAKLSSVEGQLRFPYTANSNIYFELFDFDGVEPDDLIAWDISKKRQPKSIRAALPDSGGSGASHQIGLSLNGEHTFFVAAPDAIKTPAAIEPFTAVSLDPVRDGMNGVDWLAISHGDFVPAADTLATHRADYSHLETAVVDVEQVIAQYGYGFRSSMGLKRFIQHAYDDWERPLRYLTLVGDAHFNPRHLPCSQCLKESSGNGIDFGITIESFVPVPHAFADDIQGLISSDYDYTLLAGGDLIADIAIGRLSVETATQANAAVSKIILYEDGLTNGAAWQQEQLFLHDFSSFNEAFQAQSEAAAQLVPSPFDVTVDGLSVPEDASAVRERLFNRVSTGIGMLIWRGHGSVDNWSNAPEKLLSYNDIAGADPTLINTNKPFVSISFDCLDGHFAMPGYHSISESLIRMENGRGAAAHFSSSGLGFATDHEVMSNAFLHGLYSSGLTTIGDVINYSKATYLETLSETSEVYSFVLQGDPAMLLVATPLQNFSQVAASAAMTEVVEPGETVSLTVSFENGSEMIGSSQTGLTFSIPGDLTFNAIEISAAGSGAPITGTTVLTETGMAGETIVSLLFKEGESDSAISLLPAGQTIEIGLSMSVREEPAERIAIVDAILTTPGQAPQTLSYSVNLGATLNFLPLVSSK